MSHCIIYFPGVGDDKNGGIQQEAIEKWQKFGLVPYYLPMNWHGSEPYKARLQKILKLIDKLLREGNQVSLVGASAGASMAMNVYGARKDKISSVVFISGKINRPETLGDNYKSKNPSLLPCVKASAKVAAELTKEDKKKMLTIFSFFDGTVSKADAKITGVKNKTLPVILHPVCIYLSLTLFRRISINFIKSKSVQ
jgi:predicted peptidase